MSFVPSRKRWRVRWRATNRKATEGRVFAGSQVFFEKADAVKCWVEMEAQERAWRKGQAQGFESVTQAAEGFTCHCKRHTAATQSLYALVMRRFLASLPADVVRVQQIGPRHIEQYLNGLRDVGDVNRTLNVHLTCVKAFCRYVARCYSIPNAAAGVTMLKEDPPDRRFITFEEYERLVAVAPAGVWKDRILFLANTGLRVSEFCELVRSGKLAAGLTMVTIIGKGRRKRTVPLNEICREVLARPHIYQPIHRNRVYMHLVKLSKRAGLEPMGPHALRHYCATQLLLAGVPIIKVATILGHSVKVCEAVYCHILAADLQNVTEVLVKKPKPAPQIAAEKQPNGDRWPRLCGSIGMN